MATLHMQLDFPVPKGPLGPSNSTLRPRTAPKRPRKPQNLCTLAPDSPKPKTDHILGCVAQNAISSAPNPPPPARSQYSILVRVKGKVWGQGEE